MREKISVIIPVYKSERYIGLVLEDILNQTYTNYEVIIVNDGSPDNSQKVIDYYCGLDERFHCININNGGVSIARNTGLKEATGDYIKFCDADDRIPDYSFEIMINEMKKKENIDLVIGSFSQNPYKNYYNGENLQGIIPIHEFVEDFIFKVRTFYYGVVWNKLYKKEIITNNKIQFIPNLIWAEDFIFNIEYYKQCKYINVINHSIPIYEYVSHQDNFISNMGSINKKVLCDIEKIRYDEMLKFSLEYGLEKTFELEWSYSNLKFKIKNIINKENFTIKNFMKNYALIYSLLNKDEIKDYAHMKIKKRTADAFWYNIYWIEKTKFFFLFYLYYYIRNLLSTKFVCLKKIWICLRKNKKTKIY